MPSDRASVPLIGKQAAGWDRYKNGDKTHQVRPPQIVLSPAVNHACLPGCTNPACTHMLCAENQCNSTTARCFYCVASNSDFVLLVEVRSKKRTDRQIGRLTHLEHRQRVYGTWQVSGYQVRLVEPNPDQRFRSRVVSAAAAGGGGVLLTTANPHPFKSGKAVVTLEGVHPALDGHLEVFKRESEGSFVVKGVRAGNIDFGALNASLERRRASAYAE